MKSVDWRWIYPFVADVARFFRPYTCEKIKKSKKHDMDYFGDMLIFATPNNL